MLGAETVKSLGKPVSNVPLKSNDCDVELVDDCWLAKDNDVGDENKAVVGAGEVMIISSI